MIDEQTVKLIVLAVGVAIAFATLRETVKKNYEAHVGLATELRPAVGKLTEQVAQRKEEHSVLVSKVDGVKEQLDRIEGALGSPRAPRKRRKT